MIASAYTYLAVYDTRAEASRCKFRSGLKRVALIGFRGGEARTGQLGWGHLVREQKRE
jgi:hypothetical protein